MDKNRIVIAIVVVIIILVIIILISRPAPPPPSPISPLSTQISNGDFGGNDSMGWELNEWYYPVQRLANNI